MVFGLLKWPQFGKMEPEKKSKMCQRTQNALFFARLSYPKILIPSYLLFKIYEQKPHLTWSIWARSYWCGCGVGSTGRLLKYRNTKNTCVSSIHTAPNSTDKNTMKNIVVNLRKLHAEFRTKSYYSSILMWACHLLLVYAPICYTWSKTTLHRLPLGKPEVFLSDHDCLKTKW